MTKTRNISDFHKYKVIKTLKKKRSPYKISFLLEPKEDWLIDVVKYKNKSGEVTHMSLITANDVDEWIRRYKDIMKFEDDELEGK